MNAKYPSPEDSDLVGAATRTEQRLKQLQPRPAALTAEMVLSAHEAQQQAGLSDGSVKRRNDRTPGWLTVASAAACGAVAGALLTCLVLTRGVEGDSARATGDGGKQTQQEPFHPPAIGKHEMPRGDVDETPRDGVRPRTQWSRSETVVAAQLNELGGPPSTGERPLRAGNYLRLHSTPGAGIEESAELDSRTNSTDGRRESKAETRPTLSTNAELLLEELLGVRPNSRL